MFFLAILLIEISINEPGLTFSSFLKDLSSEIFNILRSKRDEIVFKMKLTSKEETEIIIKRIEKLEQKIEKLNKKKKTKKAR